MSTDFSKPLAFSNSVLKFADNPHPHCVATHLWCKASQLSALLSAATEHDKIAPSQDYLYACGAIAHEIETLAEYLTVEGGIHEI